MTRVLHTARISNVEIIKCVVNNKDLVVVSMELFDCLLSFRVA